jgi:DsbC/DsbD-like thiol-disulfide interchange protein
MQRSTFRALALATVVATGSAAFSTSFGRAADASDWDRGHHSAVRLIAGPTTQSGGERRLRAGVEMTLAPNWKTYWRYPGDSGVPPRFDFSGSDNLKTATVLWPAPTRFADGSGTSVGYGTRVLFPLRIEATDAAKPVTLRVSLDYAVCEKLCVPVEAKASVRLPATGAAFEAPLNASEARVPRPTALAAEGALAIVSVRREADRGPRVLVDVRTTEPAATDLLAEGPTAEWALPLPEKIAGAPPGLVRFAFLLDGLPPGAEARGAVLTLTAITPHHAIETATHLD